MSSLAGCRGASRDASTSDSRYFRALTDGSAPLLLGVNLVALLYLVGQASVHLVGRIEASPAAIATLVILGILFAALGLLPAAAVAIGAGAALGVFPGAALVFVAASGASMFSFATARALGPEFFERQVGRWDLVRGTRRLLAERGLAGLWLLRAAPVLPFGLAHFALAHTQVRASAFAASSLAMLPWILFCCYCGSVMSTAESLARPNSDGAWVLAVVIAATALTRAAVRAARRALAADRSTAVVR